MVGAINPKKVRKIQGQDNQKSITSVDEKRQLIKLKREIREKKILERKLKEIE